MNSPSSRSSVAAELPQSREELLIVVVALFPVARPRADAGVVVTIAEPSHDDPLLMPSVRPFAQSQKGLAPEGFRGDLGVSTCSTREERPTRST